MATPLWPGYDKASDDELVSLLDSTHAAAKDPDDATVNDDVAGGLALAIVRHEEIKREQDPGGYRERVHQRAVVILEGWQP